MDETFFSKFIAAYKKALDKTIDSETDGDFGKLLLEILKVIVIRNPYTHVEIFRGTL